MSSTTPMILNADLVEFFRDEVTTARARVGLQVSEMTEYYVVNLLCDQVRRGTTPLPGDEPLALIFKRSLEAPTLDRIQILKNLGDLALFVAGFFGDFVERSLVDLDYYISMGGNAYSNLSDLVGHRHRGESFADVYLQLAEKFGPLVDVLMDVAERSRGNSDADLDLVKLYERWLRTGSDQLHRLLLEKGLVQRVTSPDDDLQ